MMCGKVKMLAATVVAVAGLAAGAWAQTTDCPFRFWVVFNANGGTVTPLGAATVEGKLESLPTPERGDYKFNGWFTEETGGNEVTTNTVFDVCNTRDSVYAQWTEPPPPTIGYPKITFNAAGGTVTPTTHEITNAYGIIGPLPTPVRDGFNFIGWFTAETGGYPVTEESTFSSDAVIYARWTEPGPTVVESEVICNSAGGTVTACGGTTVGNKLASPLPTPERPGYTFNGWVTVGSGGDSVSVTANTVFNCQPAPCFVHAQWTPVAITVVEVSITFDANGGTVTPTSSMTLGNKPTLLPTPKRVGYIFNGWFTAATGGNQVTTSTVFNNDATIYARWIPAVWDVSAETGTVTATLSEDGTLTISGSGAMADFGNGAAPPHLGKAAMAYAAGVRPAEWDNVTSIVIGDSVTSIGENAFDGCVNLTSVKVGRGVTSIGAGAFSGCSALDSMSYMGEVPPTIAPSAFSGVEMESVSLFVPESAAEAYETAGFGDIKGYTSVASGSRVIPNGNTGEVAVVAPVAALSGELAVGPNPVGKSSGGVAFFWNGKRIKSGSLAVYDAAGNVVKKITIKDNAGKRAVGSWDLKDAKGRQVSEGTYLVKGKIVTPGGKGERVSVVVGVR